MAASFSRLIRSPSTNAISVHIAREYWDEWSRERSDDIQTAIPDRDSLSADLRGILIEDGVHCEESMCTRVEQFDDGEEYVQQKARRSLK